MCDEAASIPWKLAYETGKERAIVFKDFIDATTGEDALVPSLPAWYGSVKKKLIEDEDDDDEYSKGFLHGIFMDMVSLEPADGQGQSKKSQTVKHKQEQKGLLEEEERRIFNDLIKVIEERTDGVHMALRKIRVTFARNVF